MCSRAIWLEIDPTHPPLIERWLTEGRGAPGMPSQQQGQAGDVQQPGRLELVRSIDDLSGRARFCEVRWR